MKTYEPTLGGGVRIKEERKRRALMFESTRRILEPYAAAIKLGSVTSR
jgi:hypothetical protein